VVKRKNYSTGKDAEQMEKALKFAEENKDTSLNKIAKDFGVSRKALTNRKTGEVEVIAQVGPKGKLSKEEEKILAKHLIEMAAIGFGYNAFQVTELVRTYMNKKDIKISNSWVFGFLNRHPEISKRRAQSLEKQRLGVMNEKTIQDYFDLLGVAFKKCKDLSNGHNLSPGRVFAADEVGFSNENTQGYILTRKGTKHAFTIATNINNHVTIMAVAAANGWVGSEFFLLAGIRQRPAFNAEMKKYFPEAQVEMTPKGYMTEESFIEWVKFFLKHISQVRGDPSLWCLLVVDGHCSHTYSLDALKLLNESRVMLICLPSHATHILQVHDVAIFHPLKEQFKSSMSKWKTKNGLNFQLHNFPEVLSAAWENANSCLTIKNGFRTTGLWPLNINWLKENKSKIPKVISPNDQFKMICLNHNRNSQNGSEELLNKCSYLDLAIPKSINKPKQENKLDQDLDLAYHQAEIHVKKFKTSQKNISSSQKNQNQIGEPYDKAKILNEPERLDKLKLKLENQKKNAKTKIPTKEDKKLLKCKTSPVDFEGSEEWFPSSQSSSNARNKKKM